MMEAGRTRIQQRFSNLWQRWDTAKLKKSVVFWIAAGAIILTVILGFTRGGWTTESGASTIAENAIVERLASICVAQFDAHPERALKLEELKAAHNFQRTNYVADQGWATMPGETAPTNGVASECAKQLMLTAD